MKIEYLEDIEKNHTMVWVVDPLKFDYVRKESGWMHTDIREKPINSKNRLFNCGTIYGKKNIKGLLFLIGYSRDNRRKNGILTDIVYYLMPWDKPRPYSRYVYGTAKGYPPRAVIKIIRKQSENVQEESSED